MGRCTESEDPGGLDDDERYRYHAYEHLIVFKFNSNSVPFAKKQKSFFFFQLMSF